MVNNNSPIFLLVFKLKVGGGIFRYIMHVTEEVADQSVYLVIWHEGVCANVYIFNPICIQNARVFSAVDGGTVDWNGINAADVVYLAV